MTTESPIKENLRRSDKPDNAHVMAKTKYHEENWEDLANMIKDKTLKRLDDINTLTSRASVIIAAIAFLLPSILSSNLTSPQLILLAILAIASFVCMAISLFTTLIVPINSNESIEKLEKGDLSNVSREDFSRWKAKSYAAGLNGINQQYEKRRQKQMLSFILLGCTMVLLVLFNCDTMVSNMSVDDNQENQITNQSQSQIVQNNFILHKTMSAQTTCQNNNEPGALTKEQEFSPNTAVDPSPSIEEQKFSSNIAIPPEPEISTETQKNNIKK